MPVQANATMVFTDYEVVDSGITLHFICYDPGPGQANDYYVLVTDAELAGISDAQQFKDLVLNKLRRKLRATGIASKLDPYINQSVVV